MEYKIYVKDYKCKLYKPLKQYNRSTKYIKNWKCNTYVSCEEHCLYIIKIYYLVYSVKKDKCADYKELSLRYISNSKLFSIYTIIILINTNLIF